MIYTTPKIGLFIFCKKMRGFCRSKGSKKFAINSLAAYYQSGQGCGQAADKRRTASGQDQRKFSPSNILKCLQVLDSKILTPSPSCEFGGGCRYAVRDRGPFFSTKMPEIATKMPFLCKKLPVMRTKKPISDACFELN
jgi:hypothetical protein